MMNIFLLFIGLSIGNFGYQFVNKKDYNAAFERSFFQAVALVAVFLLINR